MNPSDYNMIRPVDGLQNVTSLSRIQERQERKRRQEKHKDRTEKQEDEFLEESMDMEKDDDGVQRRDDDPHTIDYRA